MNQLHSMRVFLAVTESGGFASASRNLRISPVAVARAVAELEQHIGATLLSRTTRLVRVTDAGARYADNCEKLKDSTHRSEIRRTEPFICQTAP
jgi:DNA-binding transcriptional LysR family regulator